MSKTSKMQVIYQERRTESLTASLPYALHRDLQTHLKTVKHRCTLRNNFDVKLH